MVKQSSFIIHAFLFLFYMGATFYWAIWNKNSISALDYHVNFQDISKAGQEYKNWMKRYYLCLMQFSLANLGVQLFTIYIFYELTRKKSQKVIDKYSVLTHDSIKRISMLEADRLTYKEADAKHRSNSLTTQDIIG